MNEQAQNKLRQRAREIFCRDGELEIDGDAPVSEGDNVAHVQCWVWVSAEDAGVCIDDEDDPEAEIDSEDDQKDAYRSAADHPDAEIDSESRVSIGDDSGAYVEGWVGLGLQA